VRLTQSEYRKADVGALIHDGVSVEVVGDATGRPLFSFGPCVADPSEEEIELARLRALLAEIHEIASLRTPLCHWGAPGESMIMGTPLAALGRIAGLTGPKEGE
jgi:hypothetical protein